MTMRDHHDIPFAMPLMLAIIVGGFIGYLFIHFVIKEPTTEKDPTTHY
jgi:hypothetical protein